MSTTDPATPGPPHRTPPKRKARQLAKYLRDERPDYAYLKAVFRALRDELAVDVARQPKRLPYVPSDDEIPRYYEVVWKARKTGDAVLVKTLLYTGVRVAELVAIRIDDVDLDASTWRQYGRSRSRPGGHSTAPWSPTGAECRPGCRWPACPATAGGP